MLELGYMWRLERHAERIESSNLSGPIFLGGKMEDKEMLKYIEQELLKYKSLNGFHFMDALIDEIVKYNESKI